MSSPFGIAAMLLKIPLDVLVPWMCLFALRFTMRRLIKPH